MGMMLIENMKFDQLVCLIFGANLAAKPNRRLTETVKAKMIYITS